MSEKTGNDPARRLRKMDAELRCLITAVIRRSTKKRSQIAEEMSSFLGVRVTEGMLNDYTSDSKKGVRFPLAFSAAICEVLDDDAIGLLGVRLHIRKLVEFAERELAGFRSQREREALRDELLEEAAPGGAEGEAHRP